MKPTLVKTPKFVPWLYPKRIWAFPNASNEVYLTFDDGPIPQVTPWVLDVLEKYHAKATFFCIGDNIHKHPDIFQRIVEEGHTIGNHTFNHLNGFQTETSVYLHNVEAFEAVSHTKTSLFRPPYGKITQKQAKRLNKKGYRIVMWDILSYDWDKNVSERACLENVTKNIRPGSIVVFHDSLKAEKNLRYILPKVMEMIQENKWQAKPLEA